MLHRYSRWVLGVLLFINIIGYVDRSMLLGFSPQITQDLGLSNTQFGLLTGAVWVLSYGVMAVVCGSLADRHSRTRLIAVGMLIWSACTAASGFAENFGHMVAARFFVASGEAALVPAATALLADLFDEKHRSTVNGLFFTGVPLGIGLAYLLSGVVGVSLGWRGTFMVLGVLGIVIAAALWSVTDDARMRTEQVPEAATPERRSLGARVREVLRTLAERPALPWTLMGFVCVHFVVAGSYFVQLWLVRELGADKTAIAREIGLLQIGFGCLGAAGGGVLADWFGRRTAGGPAVFPIVSLLVCIPLMIASRFAANGELLLYAGLAASLFLPFSIYGSTMAIFQQQAPVMLRSTMIGIAMMSLNIVALSLGTVIAGAIADYLAHAGHATPLREILLGFDVCAALAVIGYAGAARAIRASRV